MTPSLHDEIAAFLAGQNTAGLATVADDGSPHAANVWYAPDDRLNLYFVSSPASAHSRHLARHPQAAVTVFAPTDRPQDIRGLQMQVLCVALSDPVARRAGLEVYTRRYPFVDRVPALRQRLEVECLYQARPTWLRWIDNRRGFGFKVEVSLDADTD